VYREVEVSEIEVQKKRMLRAIRLGDRGEISLSGSLLDYLDIHIISEEDTQLVSNRGGPVIGNYFDGKPYQTLSGNVLRTASLGAIRDLKARTPGSEKSLFDIAASDSHYEAE